MTLPDAHAEHSLMPVPSVRVAASTLTDPYAVVSAVGT